MNNSIKRIASLLLTVALPLSSTVSTWAATSQDSNNLCRDTGVSFIFFNGVDVTKAQADVALKQFEKIHGYTSPAGDNIKYEILYNDTGGYKEDLVEVFEQRLKEQEKKLQLSEGALSNRFELFLDGGDWLQKLIDEAPALAEFQKDFNDLKKAKKINDLTALRANPPTIANYTEHRSRLDNLILEGKKLLFVAHSQGNLFANVAYDYARTKVSADSVKVVHIAPASVITHGKHVLSDTDQIIKQLRDYGSVPNNTHEIPLLTALRYDPLGGHGLLEIYLNKNVESTPTKISEDIKKYINEALKDLVAPPTQATSGFFSANLTWNGSGDVDLHTFEPNFHVFYQSMTGNSGYLDVDNTEANGPEHYYASCDADKLRTGTYRIAVANYAEAQGRTATVQIASWNEGVLGTKSVTLGAETGDYPPYTLFNVIVSKDEQTGKYRVSLAGS